MLIEHALTRARPRQSAVRDDHVKAHSKLLLFFSETFIVIEFFRRMLRHLFYLFIYLFILQTTLDHNANKANTYKSRARLTD